MWIEVCDENLREQPVQSAICTSGATLGTVQIKFVIAISLHDLADDSLPMKLTSLIKRTERQKPFVVS